MYRWNSIRCLCNHNKSVTLALEITADLPSDEAIGRWLGEPVKCIILPSSLFITNKKGFPVLFRAHQTVVKAFAGLNVQVLISGTLRHESMNHYLQYIDHLWQVVSFNTFSYFY